MSDDHPIRALGDRFVEEWATADPLGATEWGVIGHEAETTDYSPEGTAVRSRTYRRTLGELDSLPAAEGNDRVACEVLRGHVETMLMLIDAGAEERQLNPISSPITELRESFDQLATDDARDWELVETRLSGVPGAVSGLIETYRRGLRTGNVAARRQSLACARQADTWAGSSTEAGFFTQLVGRGDPPISLRNSLRLAAEAAEEAYADLAVFLRDDYTPSARSSDAVGRDAYLLCTRDHLGADIDPVHTYEWGWSEVARISQEMADVAKRIVPGGTTAEAIDLLERDDTRAVHSPEELQRFLQGLMDDTIAQLNGAHFDIPEPVQTVEAHIAPPGGAAAMYYTGPSEDFSRPGRTWYPTQGHTRFPLWTEVSTCYHEGVPGHHLQVAQVVHEREALTRHQRLYWHSGHGEGWALYAERLMGELGYLDNPDYLLGMLSAQMLRAIRVVVDIGMHLELTVPADGGELAGRTWSAELALPYLREHTGLADDYARSEIDRYLGWPGQAIAYKVGERAWLEGRESLRRRFGADFDLATFHSSALRLGSMGLDQLERELALITPTKV